MDDAKSLATIVLMLAGSWLALVLARYLLFGSAHERRWLNMKEREVREMARHNDIRERENRRESWDSDDDEEN